MYVMCVDMNFTYGQLKDGEGWQCGDGVVATNDNITTHHSTIAQQLIE